ncbi:MAG: YggS family pyridoxal phosphate-dependent enzyme [Ignavibacteriales bacterium CG12_big_fil_rev_8_21_14_0_65_30_8]|nr:MAG: YggS family pyridoxal phosphate-dependent enzyme [Ignavibacteriales bacterium CG12_big_fil_rev_8_21_14_0_65_30_8]
MIEEKLNKIKENIFDICSKSNRDPAQIKIIAVSKNFGIRHIQEALAAGQIDFGENRPQELDGKSKLINENICWHFIGNLQKNKVKYVVRTAEFIHSVNSLALAEEINKRAEKSEKIQKILVEINTSGEETKQGLSKDSEIDNIIYKISELKNLKLIGLMTMAPYTEDENKIRKSFIFLRMLKDKFVQNGVELKHLSMGMSSDYKIAIEEGATMIRIGSAIFGERDYTKSWREL